MGSVEVTALDRVDLEVAERDFLAIAGSSGSGKSTLLNILGCVDTPSAGKLFIDGHDTAGLDSRSLARLRAKKIGFVFQNFNLLPTLDALENVEYPLLILEVPRAERIRRASEALRKVGLGDLLKRRPSEMSGGQRQRVAIARAIVKTPKIILADEPTANLDRKNAESVLELMLDLNQREGMTFVFATHDPAILRLARRTISLSDGVVLAPEKPLLKVVGG
jgi:putative ABC transport system ATP-binding protein